MKHALLAFALLLGCNVSAQESTGLDVYWVDVEGGAATLIVTPAGQSILIDSGNPGTRDANRIHEVATKQAGLKKIDFLITTHFHGDHFGGAAPLSQLMPIGTVYDNGIPTRNPDRHRQDPAFILKVKPYKTMKVDARQVVKPGMVLPLKQTGRTAKVSLTFVAAARKFIEAPRREVIKNPLTAAYPPSQRIFPTMETAWPLFWRSTTFVFLIAATSHGTWKPSSSHPLTASVLWTCIK